MKIIFSKILSKILYIFFIFLSLIIFFFSTARANTNAFSIMNIEISKPFEINFNKNYVIDEGFRKAFKGRIHGKASRAIKLNYGQFGLKAMEPERVIGKQIEAARVALTRYMKRTGKVWTRIFPNIPVSKKPTEVRMGKGKGSPEYLSLIHI